MLTLSRYRTYITECTLCVSQVLLLLLDYFWYIPVYIQWLSKALCLKRYLVTYCTIIIALNYINVYFTKCDVKIPKTSSTQVHVYIPMGLIPNVYMHLCDWPLVLYIYLCDIPSVLCLISCFLCLIGQDCPCCPDKLDSQKAASLPKKLLTGVYKIFRRSRTLPVA